MMSYHRSVIFVFQELCHARSAKCVSASFRTCDGKNVLIVWHIMLITQLLKMLAHSIIGNEKGNNGF